MFTKNVIYSARPTRVIVNRIAKTSRCYVEFPINIRERLFEGLGEEDYKEYVADVYTIERAYDPGLAEKVDAAYDEWLETAMDENVPKMTLDDVMQAVNELAMVVLGGE